jgi:hypothetical protein
MTGNPALFKLIDAWIDGKTDRVEMKEFEPYIIPDGLLTQDEIESLREEHNFELSLQGTYLIANFLPDDLRPANVKKL